MTKIIISNNPENLNSEIKNLKSVTVEAEYGDVCVEGSVGTLAHHGVRSANPAPCMAPNGLFGIVEVVGVSHLDLDALGGVLAVLGEKSKADSFWELAAFIDVNGAHKIADANASELDLDRLYAWWAWNEMNKVFPPRDGSILDITDKVKKAGEVLNSILLENDENLIKAGEVFKKAGEELNKKSFKDSKDGSHGRVALRSSDSFVNHIYDCPNGDICNVVVAYNSKFESVTISFANPGEGDNACEFVQSLWGSLAGGHKGIAGSPRGQKMTWADAITAFYFLTS